MPTNVVSSTDSGHPAPHRDRVALPLLFFGLIAGPLGWSAQLIINYGLASHTCYPGESPQTAVLATWNWVWPTLLATNVAALIVAALAAAVSFMNWRRTRSESPGHATDLLEGGEGRTRFLAVWGIMTGVGFIVATVFDLIGILGVPLCGSQ